MSNISDALRQLRMPSEETQRLVATAAYEIDRLVAARDRDHNNTMLMIQGLRDTLIDEKASWQAERENHETSLDEVMCERDEFHDIADKLAQAIADYFLAEIGEHSSGNCPWMRALEVIENPPTTSWADYETKLALADAPVSVRDYVASLERSAACAAGRE